MESWSKTLDVCKLAETFGTPLYVHNLDALQRNFEAYRSLVRDPGNIRYPVKANPSPAVVGTLARLGGGADCASKHEIDVALGAGIPIEKVAYNSPAPEIDVAVWVLRAGGTTVADSTDVLEELHEALGGELFPGKLFVRVNPGGLPGYKTASNIQRYTSHGCDTSQFGIPSEDLVDFLAGYSLPVLGLHTHVGTQMDNVDTFRAGLTFLHRLAALIEERAPQHRIRTLNLGGGLGIPFLEDQSFPAIAELRAALRPHLKRRFEYQVEPGNSLVGDTVSLLTRVVATKNTRGRRWAITDVGTDQLVKFTVARWEHQILDASYRPLPKEGPDAISGPLCFAGDVLMPNTDLGGVSKGDVLLVQHAGAYCEAVASRFNGRRSPAHVVIDENGRCELVRKSEDLFFEPSHQTFQPTGLASSWEGAQGAAGAVDMDRVSALQSEYMYELACADRYSIGEVTATGGRSYRFTMFPEAEVDFVAMPLALRMIGDAAITAVGLELGWTEKDRPIWANRLSMTCGAVIPAVGALDCRIVVGPLRPSPKAGIEATALVHYSLGSGECSGVAGVVVPERQAAAAPELQPEPAALPSLAREVAAA